MKNKLPTPVPSGVKSSTTSLALAGTVGGDVNVAVNSVLVWFGMVIAWVPTSVRLASVNAPLSVYNFTVAGCDPDPELACSIPNVTVFTVNGPASAIGARSYKR